MGVLHSKRPRYIRKERGKEGYDNFFKWLYGHRFHFILIVFITICFYPIILCWYYGDDAVTRDLYAYLRFEGNVLANHYQYAAVIGRFYPLHILQRFSVFYIFKSIYAYRIYILVMNALAIFSFAWMVKAYSGSKKIFYTVLLFYPGVFLFLARYDDAVTSYYMFMQTLVIYLSVSLIYLEKYMKKGKKGYLFFSVLLYLFSLLTYESSYLLVLVYPLALYYQIEAPMVEKLKKVFRNAIPYFTVAIVCFLIYIYMALTADSAYQGVTFQLDILKMVITFLKQVVASFPVVPHAYLIFNMQGQVTYDFQQALANITLMDIFSAVLFVYLMISLYKCYPDEGNKGRGFLSWLSVLLVVCPSILIGFSSKYQESLIWGLGYLPIYMTRFGLLLLFFFLAEWMLSRIKIGSMKKLFQVITVSTLVLVHLFCLQGNRDVVDHKNQSTYQRQIVEQSVEAGLFQDIPEGAIIYLGKSWYDYSSYNRNSIYSSFCDRRVRTDMMELFIKTSYTANQGPKMYDYRNHDVYYFDFHYYQQNEGYAYLVKLDTLSLNETEVTTMLGRELKIFYAADENKGLQMQVSDKEELVRKKFLLEHNSTSCTEISGLMDILSLELVRKEIR